MNGFFDRLRKGKEIFQVVTAKGEGYPSTHNSIVEVNFNEIKRFPDNDIASMCTVVCASDGNRGTISHLTKNQDPEEYAKSLRKTWANNPSVVMFGANEDVGGSLEFFNDVMTNLASAGFQIVDTNFGGSHLYRHGILLREKVVVRISNYSETIKYEEDLLF